MWLKNLTPDLAQLLLEELSETILTNAVKLDLIHLNFLAIKFWTTAVMYMANILQTDTKEPIYSIFPSSI